MRVLVLWADNKSANMGVRVLAEGMAALARRAWGDQIEVDFQDFGPGDSSVGFGGRTILRDIGRKSGPIKSRLRAYDVILDSGAGDSFTDIYGLKRLAVMIYTHRAAFNLRIPISMGPQTIGPFKSRIGRYAARYTVRRMTTIQARDSVSAKYAVELGRPVDALATDVVFALPRPRVTLDRDVIVNVSGLLWVPNPHVDCQSYRRAIHGLIDGLIAAKRSVTVLAHVVDNPSGDNDVPATTFLQNAYGTSIESVVPSDLAEARNIIASGRVVVGSRMHACLNALSMGVPAIAWAYSRKFAPLLSDIDWDLTFDLRTVENPAAETLRIIAELETGKTAARGAASGFKADKRLALAVESLVRAHPVLSCS